ncbi:MAG: DUF6364 family protein [Candidatus Margulisbacteria bacterium]|jgi:hypothetical protein|nr:DUF6364 family protein [Candidatus Margulisiibacteriota bacterium]
MNRKLTLSLDAKVIDFAHDFAKKADKPISKIVENYFREIKSQSQLNIPAGVEELHGIFAGRGIKVPDKKALRRRYHESRIT